MQNFDRYKKYEWRDAAGDFNSPLFRNYIWSATFQRYPKLFDIPAFPAGIFSRKNKISYICDIKKWGDTNKAFAAKIREDYRLVGKYIDATNKLGEKMNKWSEWNVYKAKLQVLSNKKLISLMVEVIEREGLLYSYGTLLPTLDFQGFSFIEGNLEKYLKSKVKSEEYQSYYETFTFPAHNSFAQDQEEALLKLMSTYDSPKWREAVAHFSPEETQSAFPKFWKDISKHAEKWGWVYYVYAGPVFTEIQFLDFIRSHIEKGIEPDRKLKEFAVQKREIKQRKAKFIKELKPDAFNKTVIDLAGTVVWAKPRRKDYQSKTYFHSEKLFTEIGKRLGLSVAEARSTPPPILKDWLLGKAKPDRTLSQEVFNTHVCLPNEDGSVSVFWGEEAEYFDKNYIIKEKAETVSETKELKGSVACRGKVRGRVCIVNLPQDMVKMREGDILVSVATTPSVVPAMKKAAAIVTEEGGLTCHAAIVSRELGVPCIIGTKVATKVLKDGMLVELNAETGIVKIIR